MIRQRHHQDSYKFGREETLRAWVKDWLGENWWRIEPSQGSTFGLPDGFFVGPNCRSMFTELKVCELKNGHISLSLTPAQKRNFPRLIAQGACLTIVAAEFGTNRVWLMRGDEKFKGQPIPFFSDSGDGVAMITAGHPELLIPTILGLHSIKSLGRKPFGSGHKILLNRKYEITGVRSDSRAKLFRIRALREIPCHDVKAGDLGGFIADESCLSQIGDCWVGGDAQVHDGAKVEGDAFIGGIAKMFPQSRLAGNARVAGDQVLRKGQVVV